MRVKHAIRGLAGAAALAGLFACASTLQVQVGWDEKADFATYHTWAWKPDGSIQDPVWARRVQDVLSDQLATDGLTQVDLDRNPDLWGVVHARFSSKTEIVPFGPDWGYAWGAWAPVDDYEVQIPVGSMIIDLVDVKQERAVWQGKASDVISPDKSNEAREEKLIAVLKQMFAGYPPGASAAAAKGTP